MGGEKETIFFNHQDTRYGGEIAESFFITFTFFIFINVRDLKDHADAFGEGPFEFEFGLVFGEAVVIDERVIDEKISAGEGGLDPERMNVGCASFAGVFMLEGSEKIGGIGCG